MRITAAIESAIAAMPKIPLMDYIGNPLLTCLFLVLLWLQWRFPLRRQHFSMLHRLVRNFVLSIPGFAIVRLAMLPIPIAIAILGATATRRVIELDSPSDVGRRDRDVPFDGLRLLVVALGHAHGAVLLAISQRASHRPGSRCEHGRAISLRRNDSFHGLSLVSRGALRYRSDHAGRVLRQF